VERVHRAFVPASLEVESEPGVVVGRRADPLERVGVYAPGGRAAYPSSVLMGVVPACVAGVRDIVVCSPPGREDARPSRVVLAAAAIGGATRVFALGGAGAVAAMAYGTESVPRVDRIVGPGNAYVAEAKLQVSSVVAIDSPAGPSELLVLADETADPVLVARELLAQAEHDPLAAVVAIATSARTAHAIVDALTELLPGQSRAAICAAALAGQGAVLWTDALDEAIAVANAYAPEHLLLAVTDPDAALARSRNAGTVFVGASASVAFGDYMTGANHVLPTGGLARSYSGLSTLDFVRWTTYQRVSPQAAARLADDVGLFADAEGLPGHAMAARAWRAGGAA
jgi:histidinol dehydrogenase